MSSINKIQKYKEFSSKRRRSGRFNRIHIEGEIKVGFISKPKPFEMIVYFTNVKKLIFDIYIDGVSINDKKLKLSFKIGDHIDKAKEWAEENGYDISYERNR